jgi:hypothetical protein
MPPLCRIIGAVSRRQADMIIRSSEDDQDGPDARRVMRARGGVQIGTSTSASERNEAEGPT